MKVTSTEFGQVTWIVDFTLPSGMPYMPEAIAKVVQRYEFVRYPTVDDILSKQPSVAFEHGKFDGALIRKFSVHTDGFLAESPAGTEPTEAFLDDFMNLLKEEYGAAVLDIKSPYRTYDSHLVSQMDIDLSSKMEFVSTIAAQIDNFLGQYTKTSQNFRPSGFYMAADNFENSGPHLSAFRIERRVGASFRDNVYFSTAPLKTAHHRKLLQEIEEAI